MTRRLRQIAVLALLAGTCPACSAHAEYRAGSPTLTYWIDASGTAQIADVASGDDVAFLPLEGNRVHLGFSNQDHWFRIELPETLPPEPMVLEFSNARLGEVALYTPDGAGNYDVQRSGVRLPFWQRAIPTLAPAFPVATGSLGGEALYARIRNSGSLRFHLTLAPENEFERHANVTLAAALSLGAGLVVVALYNLCIYMHLRQSGYLWIALFMLSCGLRQMTASATANMYLWPDAPLWARHAMTFTSLLTLLVGIGMAHNLLRTGQTAPRWARFDWAMGILALTGGLLSVWGMGLSLMLMMTSALVVPISVTAYAVVAMRRGSRSAAWFLLSWGLVLAASLVTMLVGPGYLPANLFTEHVLDIALLAAGLIWSFTLTSQIKVRQEEQRQLLETKVRERTIALEEALDAVRTLRGLVPICSCCKKVRNDEGFWEQVETYVSERTEADFSHGLCPECAESNYPAYFPRRSREGGAG